MKIITFILLLALVGCGPINKDKTHIDEEPYYYKICIGNHVYYKDYSNNRGYLAIMLNDDGKPVKCGEK